MYTRSQNGYALRILKLTLDLRAVPVVPVMWSSVIMKVYSTICIEEKQ